MVTAGRKIERHDLVDAERLGRDLRGLRKSRGLTLAEVAAAIECSVGYLSQIEHGLSAVGVADLRALAQVLGVPLSWFLRHDEVSEEERGHVVRWGRRRQIGSPSTGHVEELLSPDVGGAFEVLLCVFGPGAERAEFLNRGTEETGYLISGELDLWIGDKQYRVYAGDSFCIEREPHRWRNPGREPCEVVWVIAPPVY